MFRGRLHFAAGYISLLVHVLFCVNCCNSSSCGDIHNISFPFRLKSDPVHNCGDKNSELDCENNRTVLYLYSGKYYVQAINYYETDFGTISLVDVGIQRNNCSSLPLHSLTRRNFTEIVYPISYSLKYSYSFEALVSCEKTVKSPLYIETASNISAAFCENKGGRGGGGGGEGGGGGSSSSKKHSYVLVPSDDYLESDYSPDWSEVANLCSVDMLFPTRSPDGSLPNMTSLSEVHNALADGFDLQWHFNGAVCHVGFSAFLDRLKNKLTCKYSPSSICICFILLRNTVQIALAQVVQVAVQLQFKRCTSSAEELVMQLSK